MWYSEPLLETEGCMVDILCCFYPAITMAALHTLKSFIS